MPNDKRITIPQWIEGRSPFGSFVVRINADAVIPEDDPSEPCFEPKTAKMLDEAQRLADLGDIESLSRMGEVFVRRSA